MKASFAAVAAFAGAAVAVPAATVSVNSASSSTTFSTIAPSATDPAGCSSSYAGQFEISVVNVSASASKRSLTKRTALLVTLEDGILTDDLGRIGYIASNDQFQFDYGGQAGEIYTAGWSACSNGTLALGDSAIFYECLSGTFYNLYDESTGAQCSQIYIDIVGASDSSAATTSGAASESSDGQVTATPVSTVAISQISDGQIQATTSTAAVVSQISDGQIQATTAAAAVVSQISDGQIQATTAVAATTSAAVVSQISDGQIQATSAGTLTAAAATTNGTVTATSATAVAYTGAAATLRAELFGLAAGVLALAAL